MRKLVTSGCTTVLISILATPIKADTTTDTRRAGDEWLIVDCLLPGPVRKLGSRTTYQSPRTPKRIAAKECEIRGGEYTAHDRADINTSLDVWLEAAVAGSAEAQLNVGIIFERGLGGALPDYAEAARWYEMAATSNHQPALVNLAHLYEQGLGVGQDREKARALYQQAGVGRGALSLDSRDPEAANRKAALNDLRLRVQRLQADNDVLAETLMTTRETLNAERKASAQTTASYEQQRRSAESKLQDATALQEQQADQIETLRAMLKDSQSQLISNNLDHAATLALSEEEAQAQQQEQKARLKSAHEEVTKLGASFSQLQVLLEDKQSVLIARESEISALQNQIKQLRQIAEQTQTIAAAARPDSAPQQPPTLTLVQPQVSESGQAITRGPRQALVARVDAPNPILSVAVNGFPVEPNAAGIITTQLNIQQLPHPVELVAIDNQGQRTALKIRFVEPIDASVTTPAAVPPVNFGTFHALVIGNNQYQHLPKLQTAVNDATAVAQLLQDKYGYRTKILRNATRYELLSTLNEYREKLTQDDNLLVYYAGHGELDRVNMRGHWLPIDAEADSTANWISNTAITDILNAMAAKQVLLVADSCYAGTLTRSSIASLDTALTAQERATWLRRMTEKRARLVLTSGGLSPVMDEGGGGHSVFARSFIDVLSNSSGLLEGRKLHREVAARVAYAAENLRFDQVPEYAPIRFAGHETGEYFFVPTHPL